MARAGAAGGVARGLTGPSDRGKLGADWVPVLREVPLFEGLSKRHLRRLPARTKRFAPGTAILRAGEPGTAFFVVVDGSVRVEPRGGRPSTLKAGEAFGELALLDCAPRSADVTAVGEVLTLTISRPAFAKLLRAEPQIALALLRTLAGRLRAAER